MTTTGKNVKCDNCRKTWVSSSPPSDEEYNASHIFVEQMEILLPDTVVALRHKKGFADEHALFITDKDFCDLKCLNVYINKYMMGRDI